MPVSKVEAGLSEHPEFAITQTALARSADQDRIISLYREIVLSYIQITSLYVHMLAVEQQHRKDITAVDGVDELFFPDALQKEPQHD